MNEDKLFLYLLNGMWCNNECEVQYLGVKTFCVNMNPPYIIFFLILYVPLTFHITLTINQP